MCLFFLGKISPENASNDILQRKNAFLDYKNKNLIKSKNKHSFKGDGSMVLVKIFKIFHLSILGKTGENNTFHDILEGKKVYLDNKNKNLKKSRNEHFLKGLVHGFGQKFELFLSFYSRQNRQE